MTQPIALSAGRFTRLAIGLNVGVALVIATIFGAVLVATIGLIDDITMRSASATMDRWYAASLGRRDKVRRMLAGEPLSAEEQARLEVATKVGELVYFELYNSDGRLRRIHSNPYLDAPWVRLADMQIVAKLVADPTRNYTEVIHTDTADGLHFEHARVYKPIVEEGELVGVLTALFDKTRTHKQVTNWVAIAVSLTAVVSILALAGTLATTFLLLHKRRSEETIHHLAHHDTLTGVANRAKFIAEMDAVLLRARAGYTDFAVHMIDLDHFKAVNDMLGHDAGDDLLREVARALTSSVRKTDLVARLGGDEFSVVQRDIHDAAAVAATAQAVVTAVRGITTVDGAPVSVSASVGVAAAFHDCEPIHIQRYADAALYHAKEAGRDQFVLFEPGMEETVRARTELRNRLRQALDNDGFELYFQPLHDARDSTLRSFEALLRLSGGEGFISPSEFIPVAEDMGITPELGAWVLHEATRIAAQWPEHLNISVNLSPQQFSGDVVEVVKSALEQSGLAAERLELEITENLFINDHERVEAQLHGLKDMGVRVVMDDFGTGYSSLQHLWKFPFDKLKVDRSCISSLGESEQVGEILRTISAMSSVMSLTVTAEGIETEMQRDFARNAGYDEVQGFLFSRPIPQDDIAQYISTAIEGVAGEPHLRPRLVQSERDADGIDDPAHTPSPQPAAAAGNGLDEGSSDIAA